MAKFDRVVYLTTNNLNGKQYVGQDSYNRDWYIGSGKLLKLAIEKYGIHNFTKKILCKCNTKEETDEMEKFWISKLNTIEKGYNIMPGGKGNGYREYVEKMSEKMSGSNNPMHKRSVKEIWIEKYGEEKALEMWNESNVKRSINGKNKGVKPVLQYDKENNLIREYESVTNATKETNISTASICAVCKGHRKHAGGFKWSWKKNS